MGSLIYKLPGRKRIVLAEVVEFVVDKTGCSQAEAGTRLVQGFRDGDLTVEGVHNFDTDAEKFEPIPRGLWIHFSTAQLFGEELRRERVLRLDRSTFHQPDMDKAALEAWLLAGSTPAAELAASQQVELPIATGSPLAKKRARAPRKRLEVEARMRDDLDGGRLTQEQLHSMLEKELEDRYGVVRDTARKARNRVLSLFVEK